LELAQPEITKLNDKIAVMETGYEKELADTLKQVKQRYSEKLDALNSEQRDEFESKNEFKAKLEKKRTELNSQRDAELTRLNVSTVAETETAPLKARIKALTDHEYIVGSDGIDAELGSYDSDEHQFPIKLRSKSSTLKLKLNGFISLQGEDAKEFKQQWLAGLFRPEAKAKLNGELVELALVNEANNSRLTNYAGIFLTSEASKTREVAESRAAADGYVYQGGLTWRPPTGSTPDSAVTWAEANAYCDSTTINGQSGWRLPTKDELKDLYASGAIKNWGGKLGQFWSSTTSWFAANGDPFHTYYRVYLADGDDDTVNTRGYSPVFGYVTCVRESPGLGL
jgi:hypothetical protein